MQLKLEQLDIQEKDVNIIPENPQRSTGMVLFISLKPTHLHANAIKPFCMLMIKTYFYKYKPAEVIPIAYLTWL